MGSAERDERWAGAGRRLRAATSGNSFRASVTLVALGAALVSSVSVAGEFNGTEPVAVRDAIGGGIHAYHAGDFDRAYDDLTNAIEAGTDDPRSYYFRGLAALKLGRTSEAEADFTTGADRELSTGSIRRVSQSLERVQGHDRLTLERFRARARLGALQRDREVYGSRTPPATFVAVAAPKMSDENSSFPRNSRPRTGCHPQKPLRKCPLRQLGPLRPPSPSKPLRTSRLRRRKICSMPRRRPKACRKTGPPRGAYRTRCSRPRTKISWARGRCKARSRPLPKDARPHGP